MKKTRYTPEQIIAKLREAEVVLAKGGTVGLVCKQIGVTEQTFCRWRKEYGGLKVAQAKRLKELEKENGRLRRAVADLTLDKLAKPVPCNGPRTCKANWRLCQVELYVGDAGCSIPVPEPSPWY